MKKLIVLTLCLALLISCFAACKSGKDNTTGSTVAAGTTVPAESATDPQPPADATRINYKGLETATFTEAEMKAAEGRDQDFDVPQGDAVMYIYNNVTLDTLAFTQVQYTFSEQFNRISCTYTGEGPDATLENYKAAMTAIYGEPTSSTTGDGQTIYSWHDGVSANYLQLMLLNADTVQLVFYLCEGAQ